MIWNIIDCRKRRYRWARINAIIEATWHDNSCADTDIAPTASADTEVMYDEREGVALHEAIAWANQQSCPVTLYLYDEGAGIGAEAGTQGRLLRCAIGMTGPDIFFGCLGVSAIIIALGAARSIPEALRTIERISMHDPKAAAKRAQDGPPWGARP